MHYLSKSFVVFVIGAIFLFGNVLPASSEETNITLLLTSSLNGRFTTDIKDQDQKDPMLKMAQSLILEQQNGGADLYLDLGNSFNQGILTRYSSGSLMMDYLDYFKCAGTVVSSQDLKIGVSNLEFLNKGKKLQLLSANITKNNQPVFKPYFITTIHEKKFAVIGLTSQKALLDIAEKQLMGAKLQEADKAMKPVMDEIKAANVDFIILLSGLPFSENVQLLDQYKEIRLCISGGDTQGKFYEAQASRVDLTTGQTMISLTDPKSYYTLNLSINGDTTSSVRKLARHIPTYTPSVTYATNYNLFVQRLKLWKNRFAEMGSKTVAKTNTDHIYVDAYRVAQLMRHNYNAEVAMIEMDAISPRVLSGNVTYSDVLGLANNGYPIFVYKLNGEQLLQARKKLDGTKIVGIEKDDMVQGFPIDKKREYRIASTQSLYDKLTRLLGKEVEYTNTWKTIPEEIRSDLRKEQIIARQDFSYIDRRFRTLMDVNLFNFYEQTDVTRGPNISTPAGKPSASYSKWGMENKIDLTFYNRYHSLVITPYMYYVKQDDDINQNMLRGTVFYTYNVDPHIKPYFKSQVDTVVAEEEDDLRPVLLRETVGAFFDYKYVSGGLGLGIEKQVQDPEQDLRTGLEGILNAKFEIVDNLLYTFNANGFYGVRRLYLNQNETHVEVNNALTYKLNSYLGLSVKYKWFYQDSLEYEDERYTDSQLILGLDVTTDFKFF